VTTRKIFLTFLVLVLFPWTSAGAGEKDLEVQGKRLVSLKPPFTLTSPSELNLVYSFSQENPGVNSLTRVYFLVKAKGKQVEEMLILQIADKANPRAGPMAAPPLKPYTEERMYSKGRTKKGEVEGDHLIQLMAWNPDAPSLQPIVKKGIIIPPHWALQGQFLFPYQTEHVILIRYSRDVRTFGLKISEEEKAWRKGSISGNEKRAYEIFQKSFLEMVGSIEVTNP
jgi:hypothetical protein